ncbi:MAG: exodeoxyribonuclease V subunit gamma, partial [Deltaproteobacteria bacterium]|nr:exodeoxyribonuclease V subunit gamma [Deltaproteobacteria bacterium]
MLVALERELQDIGGDSGFFTGGITFSSILPLRSVPAQMICLLGLNDGEFPRNQRPLAYDLVAARPRAGDRNPRDEDRYLFLETLLAARKTLVLSYLGRDPKDNHLRPPAVVVSELIDYIEEYFVPPPESGFESMRDFLLFDHPPQPFSSCYFQAQNSETASRVNPLFSYDVLQSRIATEINARGKKRAVFSGAVLEPKFCNRIKISDLLRFFSNPAKFFLRERLKVNPGIKELDCFDDSEPFALDGLASYKFNDELVSHFMADLSGEGDCKVDISELEKRFAASGTLPPRTPGRIIFADKVQGAQTLAAQLKPYCDKPLPLLQKEVVLRLSGGEVVVEIDLHNLFLGEDGIQRQVLYRPAQEVKDKDRVKSAIMNLGLEIVSPSQTDLNDGVNDTLEPVETRFHTLKVKGALVLPVRDAESGRTELKIL